jgi:PAS domain-containing protein
MITSSHGFEKQQSAASAAQSDELSVDAGCFSRDPEAFSRQCSAIDDKASTALLEGVVEQSLMAIAAECDFCISISDPRKQDYPLIAVSDRFESLTGFGRSEVLGKNCRFLNAGQLNPADMMALRITCATGAPFTGVLENRKKSGETFLNLLDLRGLTVAHNAAGNEELWFLIGIQCDVSMLCEDEMPESHIEDLRRVATLIRTRLAHDLGEMALNNTATNDLENTSRPQSTWQILEEPVWRVNDESQPPGNEAEHNDLASCPPCVSTSDHENKVSKLTMASTNTYVYGIIGIAALCAAVVLLRASRVQHC